MSDTENPFSPGYGEAPPFLAGREELLNDTILAWRRGPGRAQFHRILIGPRGTGKTATLNAIADLASGEHAAVVLRWTAGSRPLADAVQTGEGSAGKQLLSKWHRAKGSVDASATVGVPGIASASASRHRGGDPLSIFARLERLARLAAKRDRVLIVWIDEAQNATPAEIATLAAVMQELANGQRLPIAVCAAGLPDTRPKWIDAASPLERQEFTVLGNLDADDTAAAFEIPILDGGRTIDDGAIDRLVRASGGFPYAVQLMGAAAWDAADGANIDAAAAATGVSHGLDTLRGQLFVARWRQMSPAIQRYLRAAAEVEDRSTGLISSSAVARRLGVTTSAVSVRRAELIETHQVLVNHGRDRLEFAHPGFGEWVRSLDHHQPGHDIAMQPNPAPDPLETRNQRTMTDIDDPEIE